ncbi:MAG TPA: glycosyltransferase family 61 protein [Rariglobus sp.]|nr:glycosyltransferase family 61 protein [Rariglobus sp.]
MSERFFNRLQQDIPAGHVIRLPRARLLGPDGWVVGASDSFLVDASYHIRPDPWMNMQQHYMLRRRKARPLRKLSGRTLSLASDFSHGGFGHFLHDSLCRLFLLERAGIDPAGYDQIYWPRLDSPIANQLVEASGIPLDKIINADPVNDLECEDITVTSFPGLPAHITPPFIEFLRRRFSPPPLGQNRKIYLTRAGFRRNFVNAAEIDDVFALHGYEICHPHSDLDILAKCAAASHIVALEGSNFFNAFAAPPGTKSLIILPSSGQTLPYTLSLSNSAGFESHLLMAESIVKNTEDTESADVYLEPELLARTLTRIETSS